jgi:HK97 family phage prohead protease
MKNKIEIRARQGIQKRALTDAEKAAGYIGVLTGKIPFNSDSQVMTMRGRSKPFIEQIAPDAFKRSLKEDTDIMASAGHTDDPLSALGRIGKNLSVVTDGKELRWEALVPDTRACADMLVLVDQDIITGTSFEFQTRGADGEKWEARDARVDLRTITDARLLAFNPVTYPAYPDASLTVEMRRRQARSYVMECDEAMWCDPTLTTDAAFAGEMLDYEFEELESAQEYLRANPSGPLADYARKEAAESADDIAMLVKWLADNGATVNPDYAAKAADASTARNLRAATATLALRHKFFQKNA